MVSVFFVFVSYACFLCLGLLCSSRVHLDLELAGYVSCACFQGIDLEKGGRFKVNKRTAPASANPYVLLLVKVVCSQGAGLM